MAFFPAYDQKSTGKYKLIVVAEIFQSGYGNGNIRTVTIDYPDVFELVSSSTEADVCTSVAIQVGNGNDPTITDICISPASITDVIAGNLGMIMATVCPSTNSNQNFLWQFDDEYLNVFDDKGTTLVFATSNIPVTSSGKYTTDITVYAADNINISKTVRVTIHNHLDHIDISTPIDASKLSNAVAGDSVSITPLYKEIAYGEDMVIVPTVVLQNGDKVSYYNADDGQIKYSTNVKVVDGMDYIITNYDDEYSADQYIVRLTDGTLKIRNNNTSGEMQRVTLCITSEIADMSGEMKSFLYSANLAPKA